MLENIVYALEYCNKLVEIDKIHLSNFAVDEIIPKEEIRMIGYSYEDNNIPSIENAKATANIISTLMPNEWVLIDTGDYIISENHNGYDLETYDASYCYYLIHKSIFDKYKNSLLSLDEEWRNEKNKLANPLKENENV